MRIDQAALIADLRRQLAHCAEQAGPESCAAVFVENERLRAELERLNNELRRFEIRLDACHRVSHQRERAIEKLEGDIERAEALIKELSLSGVDDTHPQTKS